MSAERGLTFALAGNPNSGKTTLFNYLTGSTAHVGNWPGVTVDRKEGVYRGPSGDVFIVDLPGIYSLSPYTPEEIVARRYILDETPDLIINIVDSTNLERNLYLTTQILETDTPVVIALNMSDVLRREGGKIDSSLLSSRLGVPVVSISAIDREGVLELMEVARASARGHRDGMSPLAYSYAAPQYDRIVELFRRQNAAHPLFLAAKAIEGDAAALGRYPLIAPLIDEIRESMTPDETGGREDSAAGVRYRFIAEKCADAVKGRAGHGGISRSDRIDRVLTGGLFGLPVFIAVMFLVFHLTFSESIIFSGFVRDGGIPSPGAYLQGCAETFAEWAAGRAGGFLEGVRAPAWLYGLLIDGLASGVGSVLSFLPQILMLFSFLSVMEDSGYMARAAMLMDRPLRRFGLSGRAFLPMLMGFGCSVPAMMGTRTLASEKERRLVIMLMPFFSCGAKLPIWSMFASAFFPRNADLVVFGMYVIGIATAVVTAIILRRTVMKGDASFFIMELPAYRMPRFFNLVMHIWEKARGFVKRASTIIAGSTIVIWFLSNFGFGLRMVEPNSGDSIVGAIASFVLPVFRPLGFASLPGSWKAVVAIVTGLIAKEMVVSTLGVLYGADAAGENAAALSLALGANFSHAGALSFMTFNLLCTPCMAAVAAARMELRSPRLMAGTIMFWLAAAWAGSFIVYHAARIAGI
ncbi:MAG: ferrous iron transport protein B [Synergistaceae bacterium]|jgi:ferrous iron transport protein B|nr:ferrous iron transport protein B [Synergistaceae bacterium]